MKIAISATAPNLDASVDPRFGRAPYFIIADTDSMQFEAIENSSAVASGGAGISTAQMIAGKAVQAVLTGSCGPNAYEVLSAAGVQVITGASGKVRDAILSFKQGRLMPPASAPNAPPHSGMGGGFGRGMGRGMGGFGMRRGVGMPSGVTPQPLSKEEELEGLKTQAEALKQQLAEINHRIDELTSED
jgi:predicted Fe-Mo cluster-binding NifX family protein